MKGRRRRGDGAPSDTTGRDPVISKEPTPQPSCRKARGVFLRARRNPSETRGTAWPPSPGPGEPVGGPSDGAAASGRPQPHLNTPHRNHKAPHLNRANHSPCLPSGERSPVGRDAPGERFARGRVGRLGHLGDLGDPGTPGISGTPGTPGTPGVSGTSGASEPHGGRGARGTSGREVLERSKRSRGDLRETL